MNKLKFKNMNIAKINNVIITLFIISPLLFEETILLNFMRIKFNSLFVILTLSVLFFLLNKDQMKSINIKRFRFNLMFVVFLSIVVISSITSEYRLVSMKRLILIIYITVSLVSMLLISRKDIILVLKLLIKVMNAIALFSAMYYLLFLFFGVNVIENNNIVLQKINISGLQFSQIIVGRRPSSIFLNPNSLGLFMYLNLILQCLLIFINKSISKSNLINIITSITVLLGSKSRAPLFSFVIFVFIFIIFFYQNNPPIFSYKIFFLILISVIMITYIIFSTRSGKGSSGRLEMWIRSIKGISQKPIFGIGYGLSNKIVNDNLLSTHNMYLKIAIEIGLINLYIIFHSYLVLILRLIKTFQHDNKLQTKCMGILITSFLISFSFYQLFESTLFIYNYAYNVIIVLIIYSMIYIGSSPTKELVVIPKQ